MQFVELTGFEPRHHISAGNCHFLKLLREEIPVIFPFLPNKTGNYPHTQPQFASGVFADDDGVHLVLLVLVGCGGEVVSR